MSPRTKATGKNGKASDIVIPEKLYFRIGEVARLCKLPAYVLRFWETEFPQLKPVKSSTGQRMYRHKDVESVLRIKTLLYEARSERYLDLAFGAPLNAFPALRYP